ncbi:MAG: ATP-binding cassette domain-containing protein [Alphaproteobacteria bacterium]
MIHKPIQIKDLDLSFSNKTCFTNFNCQITYGSRIAIIGRNGSGKSTLLKMIAGYFELSVGSISCTSDIVTGYVPQIIEDHTDLSGGERLNSAVTEALSFDPNVLLLDEPTNHLDHSNRKGLMRMLKTYPGTLIIASHDIELLRNSIDTLWHIDNGKINVFSGNYEDYIDEIKLKRVSIENELIVLSRQKKDMHDKLMQEQSRTAKSKAKGEKKVANRKWLKMVGDLKGMKAQKSQGKKLKAIDTTKNYLKNKLANLRLPEIIVPKFSIENSPVGDRTLVQISDGSVGYKSHPEFISGSNKQTPKQVQYDILSNITLSLSDNERIAITGDNGSGKSTLIKKPSLGIKILIKLGTGT